MIFSWKSTKMFRYFFKIKLQVDNFLKFWNVSSFFVFFCDFEKKQWKFCSDPNHSQLYDRSFRLINFEMIKSLKKKRLIDDRLFFVIPSRNSSQKFFSSKIFFIFCSTLTCFWKKWNMIDLCKLDLWNQFFKPIIKKMDYQILIGIAKIMVDIANQLSKNY